MRLIRRAYDLFSLASLVVVGQLAGLIVGDCGWVYYYAGMLGLGTGYGLVGALHMMRKIGREPVFLAHLAFQMRREVDEGEHPDVVRAHYARLSGVVEAEAETREPGVVRRAWAEREARARGPGRTEP
jgi:hypothetical protein